MSKKVAVVTYANLGAVPSGVRAVAVITGVASAGVERYEITSTVAPGLRTLGGVNFVNESLVPPGIRKVVAG